MTNNNQDLITKLESHLWEAANILRGPVDAADFKTYIFPLLFFKRISDVHDEEYQAALAESGGDQEYAEFPQNYRFQIPENCHWNDVRTVNTNIGQALQNAFRGIEKANPDTLFSIFGDAQWTNKERLSDALLRDLIEHFSRINLANGVSKADILGQSYEYLIKKFADDSGHTAAEFYTNRTVVHLMTELLQPQPEESIYDPTCGSGGMLISCIAQLRRQGKEWRNVHLYGQERNLMTSSIARMNCFLHGIEGFRIERGDTLSEPKFVQGDRLQQFDLVLANPPYSIKQWDRTAFSKDPWGRNLYGTPPQGRADYAFWQHILCSLKEDTGRCAILFPHGVLFRQEEEEMRHKIIEADVIECIIGLGPNLFYNSPMEACIVICRMNKPPKRRGKILLVNAVDEVTRERAQSFLTDEHIERITGVYNSFKDTPGFSKAARLEEIRRHDWNLSIPLYVIAEKVNGNKEAQETGSLENTFRDWWKSRRELAETLKEILPGIKPLDIDGDIKINVDAALVKDKNNWKRVKFGDVVENVNETENDPLAAGITRYIGLEHLEPGSLHVRTWGNVVDGTTFTRRCHQGQVLFGKRRAYQRKIAVAEFDAIVSGDIYVLEAKKGYLVQELLPFICSSDNFFKHAVGTSSGSLSPRTNWTSLAKYELNLPPLDQQKRIADLLWAVDAVLNNYIQLRNKAWIQLSSLLMDAFSSKAGKSRQLDELFRIKHGWAFDGDYFFGPDQDPILLTPGNFSLTGELFFSETNTKHYSGEYPQEYILSPGDLVLVMTDLTPNARLLGMPALVNDRQLLHNQRIGKVIYDSEQITPVFAYYLFLSDVIRSQIRKTASGTTVRHTSPGRILESRANIPTRAEQETLSQVFNNSMNFYKRSTKQFTIINKLAMLLREYLLQWVEVV